MFSRFFIDRPIFAAVLSIIITLAGGITLFTLPLAQYPDITPPTVEVSAYYPGANAQVVADTVAAPIEQQVNGVENMMYMSSQCTNDGNYTLTVTFKPGVDLNMAQVLVQNRESLAEPILPDLVKRRGVSVKKKSPSILMIINVFSPDASRDNLYLSNYATIQLRDELARLDGIGDITYIGQRNYSMRVWLDPQKMTFRNLTSSDVISAIEQQNIQVAAGQLGQPPIENGQAFQFTITTLGRLSDSEQFADMVLKADAAGGIVRLRDVARVELGAQGYDQACTLDGRPSVALSVYQRPGSNALETANSVRAKMEELKERFPEGLDYAIVYDTTPFIVESVNEVFKTLRDAVILVAVVVLLFLQNWRSALIPLIAVPVAVVGTFAVMAALGFSLNNLTLFGLVLAIGIVVDDAIVVVEAVEHHIEHGRSPREATIKAMEQVSAPVIAVGLVLSAVFIPCAFITGITGQFFRQFALTIATSTVISAFNSLTLSPALAALLLKPRQKGVYQALPRLAFVAMGCWAGLTFLAPHVTEWTAANLHVQLPSYLTHDRLGSIAAAVVGCVVGWILSVPLNRLMGWTFFQFNKGFDAATGLYTRIVGGLLRVSVLVLVLYGGLLGVTYWGFTRTPTGFIPSQDKGYLLVNIQLPDSSSLERTQRAMKQAEAAALKQPGVTHTLAIAGQSILMNANAPNFGAMYVMLDEFHTRAHEGLGGPVIAASLQHALQEEIQEGLVNVFEAPPVDGLGTAGGFKIVIEDRGDLGAEELETVANRVVAAGSASPVLQGLFTSFRANTPWLYLDIDREKTQLLGVSISELFNTLQVYLGSLYVNDFNRFGRTWQVNVQGEADFRKQIADLSGLRVRSEQGAMVPLGTLAKIHDVSGPVMIIRYNLYPAATINLNSAPGVSSGQALDAMQKVVSDELPQAMRSDWTELALLQLQTGNTAMLAFGLAVVLVFLVLAAQFESWALPMAVILVVPMCLLCSTVGVNIASMDINIFTQVGFIVLVGLACKNAILIVEFAKSRREYGATSHEATIDACELRLRPIIMTSLAFILGVVPLILSSGAGAEMRKTLGVAVFSGMLGVTLFGIFLTPVFYYVIQRVSDLRTNSRRDRVELEAETEDGHGHGHAFRTHVTDTESADDHANGRSHAEHVHAAHTNGDGARRDGHGRDEDLISAGTPPHD
ncbi:MAG: efflux RND transporter permease subunit [Paludisphaera borealis]|uniref:efflux RND transporter permease subunit n=1 Tax=Paludisphaera borealis TaxID=1387353 RepID=UPI00283E34F8|nr:efflux RND transporter permease subunit [Paludisphaera borealis]MDR3619951.1 efflux RND transporter permease subunit [Paludisphaera borealis]